MKISIIAFCILVLINKQSFAKDISNLEEFISKTPFCKELGCTKEVHRPHSEGGTIVYLQTVFPKLRLETIVREDTITAIYLGFDARESKVDRKVVELLIQSVINDQKIEKKLLDKIIKAAQTKLKGPLDTVSKNGKWFNIGHTLIKAGKVLSQQIVYIEPSRSN